MVIHLHLCLTDGGLDQLMDRCRGLRASASASLASAAVRTAPGEAVVSAALASAAGITGSLAAGGLAVAGSPSAARTVSRSASAVTAGRIGTGAAGIGTALSALRVSAGHDDDLFLLGGLFGVFRRFFLICSRLLHLRCGAACSRSGCCSGFFFRLTLSCFKAAGGSGTQRTAGIPQPRKISAES